ncbi:MAG: DEAD/DEAH box helicase family protein, partial [Thermodesulfovibrionia bacterium]|nr:DEAD/DEAH box helicase family protein [Thermodesulfovibrionia bacterium]
RDNKSPLSQELINKDIAGRPYQIQAIRSVLEGISKKQRKFLLVMATGTGKTRTCMALIDVLMRSNWVQRVLFLVDRIALQDQALDNFQQHLPNAPFWPQRGEKDIVADRRVYVSTYPTILNIIRDEAKSLSPHFFDLVVADESHRSIYNIYQEIFQYYDCISLGLTATPKESIDHNTFKMFQCDKGLPTFAYSYRQALDNDPPYLSDFEALHIQTKFQQEGINSQTISNFEKERLETEGKDLDDIDFEGTELEKRVANKGTNTLIVRQFMEESIKDHNGVLPGKSIFFAMTQNHAFRLCEIFDVLYPEYKGELATVITSSVKGTGGKGGLLDRFKNQDMPRIAISVDMLDTGIDIREVVNLVFAKPVFSYTKFWQMIGRGTRVLDPIEMKPWCLKKDKFLILDCWGNFEYFKMKPKGKDDKQQKSLPVRLFEARLDKLVSAQKKGVSRIQQSTIEYLQKTISKLPEKSVTVLEKKAELAKLDDNSYWTQIDKHKHDFLKLTIAPVMKAISHVDFKAMRFSLDVTDLSTA